MCNSGMGGQSNSYGMPGFVPGGPDDPAFGGSGYMNGGSFGSGNVQPGFTPGGSNDPAFGGSGYQTYPNRPPMGNPIGYNPPVQNPGMPSFPNGPGNMINNPIFQPIQNPGMPSMGGSFRPPVQNPGMQMPPSNASGILIDGGPQGNLYNPQGAFQNLAKGTMPSMKRFVQAGKMGKAKQAFEAGGGTWNKSVHSRLKSKYGTGN